MSAGPAALITGAGRRVGRAIAEALAADGWRLAIHYNRSAAEAEALAGSLPGAVALAADLADPAAVRSLVPRAAERLGPLHALVNNASLFENDAVASVTEESFDRHMAVNARAPLFLARAFAEQAPEGEGAVVVNLLDQKLWNMNPDFLSYTASKVALQGLTTMLAMALAPRVRVVGVAPGLSLRSGKQTEEGFSRAHASVPLGRGSEPADIAGAVRYLLTARAVTGSVLLVDGGEHLGRRPRDVAFQIG